MRGIADLKGFNEYINRRRNKPPLAATSMALFFVVVNIKRCSYTIDYYKREALMLEKIKLQCNGCVK